MRKETVRQLAEQLGLHVAAKKSSTGLCFVGKRRFDDFVGQYLEDRPGEIRSVEGGCVSFSTQLLAAAAAAVEYMC
jgi:tRNA-specific 2-thiouridylase